MRARLDWAAGIADGFCFIGVVACLLPNAVLPISADGRWRGPADGIAVGDCLIGVVPLMTLALSDLRWIGGGWPRERRMWWRAACVAVFLVVAHVAMIFGMLDPALLHDAAMPADHTKH